MVVVVKFVDLGTMEMQLQGKIAEVRNNFFENHLITKIVRSQECTCDRCGSQVCDHHTGECTCKPNMMGRNCNSCIENHWGSKTCQGCRPCNCGGASIGLDCDDETGQCRCRPGVGGPLCHTCLPGYWKYTPFGCICKTVGDFLIQTILN